MGKFTKRNNIVLSKLIVANNVVRCQLLVSDPIKHFFTGNELYMVYDEDMTDIPESILACPFVATLLAFTWITDSVLWVNDIDRTFYESLSRVKQGYQDIYTKYVLKGRLVPSVISNNHLPVNASNNKSLILFSGGADCHSSLIRNLSKKPVLCNIQGWYKSMNDVDPVAEADKRDIEAFAREMVLPFSYVTSNFAKIMNLAVFDNKYQSKLGDSMWHGFLHSMAFISIAVPLAYKHGIDEIIIASSLTTGLNFLCASNTTTDAEFKYSGTGLILHDGFELHRQNKIHIITDYQRKLGRPYFMRVCSFHDSNCCHCEKCFRTVLGIVAENSNPEDFGFHISESLKQHWQKAMNEHIALMSFDSEKSLHWPHIISRMKYNYERMDAEKKEFVDWFLKYDFNEHKKKALRKYYTSNFFKILKRKLKC